MANKIRSRIVTCGITGKPFARPYKLQVQVKPRGKWRDLVDGYDHIILHHTKTEAEVAQFKHDHPAAARQLISDTIARCIKAANRHAAGPNN